MKKELEAELPVLDTLVGAASITKYFTFNNLPSYFFNKRQTISSRPVCSSNHMMREAKIPGPMTAREGRLEGQ